MINDVKDNCLSGFVITYKEMMEPLLFNEVKFVDDTVKLIERNHSLAAFYCDNVNEFIEKIKLRNLVFAQHIHPFNFRLCLSGEEEFQSLIYCSINRIIDKIDKDKKYICQCRISSDENYGYSEKEITKNANEYLMNKGVNIDIKDATVAISITIINRYIYIGVSKLEDNISDRAGGILYYSKNDDIICRAEFKLEEAMKYFKIDINSVLNALDLGAAPGGWTHYLSKNNVKVDAVDPAKLDLRLNSDLNVTHYNMLAQKFVKLYPNKYYDLIVNDMKMDTKESVDIVCSISDRLNKNGVCIITLKLPKKNITKKIKNAEKILRNYFDVVKIKQLYYNRTEVTVFAQKNRI